MAVIVIVMEAAMDYVLIVWYMRFGVMCVCVLAFVCVVRSIGRRGRR